MPVMVIGTSLSPARFGRRAGFFVPFFMSFLHVYMRSRSHFALHNIHFAPFLCAFICKIKPIVPYFQGTTISCMPTIRETVVLRIVLRPIHTLPCRIRIVCQRSALFACHICTQCLITAFIPTRKDLSGRCTLPCSSTFRIAKATCALRVYILYV